MIISLFYFVNTYIIPNLNKYHEQFKFGCLIYKKKYKKNCKLKTYKNASLK